MLDQPPQFAERRCRLFRPLSRAEWIVQKEQALATCRVGQETLSFLNARSLPQFISGLLQDAPKRALRPALAGTGRAAEQ